MSTSFREKIRFLGLGGAFEPQFGNSSAVVDCGKDGLILIDCGGTVYEDLCRLELVGKIAAVLITHVHDDHVGSLGSLLFHHKHILARRLCVHVPQRLFHPVHTLLNLQSPSSADAFIVRLDEAENGIATIGEACIGWIDTTGKHSPTMASCAYILTFGEQESIVYSGDLGDPDMLFHALTERQIACAAVYHDCSWMRLENRSHAYYRDLEPHLGKWELYGYHHNPLAAPADNRVPSVYSTPAGELVRQRMARK